MAGLVGCKTPAWPYDASHVATPNQYRAMLVQLVWPHDRESPSSSPPASATDAPCWANAGSNSWRANSISTIAHVAARRRSRRRTQQSATPGRRGGSPAGLPHSEYVSVTHQNRHHGLFGAASTKVTKSASKTSTSPSLPAARIASKAKWNASCAGRVDALGPAIAVSAAFSATFADSEATTAASRSKGAASALSRGTG